MKNFLDWLTDYINSGWLLLFTIIVASNVILLSIVFIAWTYNPVIMRMQFVLTLLMLIPVAAYWIDTKEKAK